MRSRSNKHEDRPVIASFRNGVETLVRSLGDELGDDMWTGAKVLEIHRGRTNGKACLRARFARGASEATIDTVEAETVVVAAPTRAAGAILATLSPRFAELLAAIPYAPVAVVALGYRRDQVAHPLDGFGFLVPRSEGLRVLGTVWNSSLFPGRAPEGHVLLTSFLGGATDPQIVAQPEESLAAVVERELAGVLGITGAPVARRIHRLERALPQYNLGHGAILSALGEELARFSGLFLAGNYLGRPRNRQLHRAGEQDRRRRARFSRRA